MAATILLSSGASKPSRVTTLLSKPTKALDAVADDKDTLMFVLQDLYSAFIKKKKGYPFYLLKEMQNYMKYCKL